MSAFTPRTVAVSTAANAKAGRARESRSTSVSGLDPRKPDRSTGPDYDTLRTGLLH
jgi:hypothetical protein